MITNQTCGSLLGGLAVLATGLALAWPASHSPTLAAASSVCGEEPASNEVILFQHAPFREPCQRIRTGRYDSASAFGLPNDSLSSLKVGTNARAILFSDSGYRGERCVLGPGAYSNLSSLGFNDRTSSIRVDPTWLNCNKPPSFSVAVFQHANYKGDCTVLGVGRYDHSAQFGMANDSISSLIVGSGVIVKFCSDANGKGRCQRFGDLNAVPTLVGSGVGNDAISSIYVPYCGRLQPPCGPSEP